MPQPPELNTLERVVTVNDTRDTGSGRIMCVSLEQYNDGAYVNFWAYPQVQQSPHWMPMLGVVVADNLGTSYRAWIGGGAGSDTRCRLAYMIEPAIASDAEWLELSVRLGRFREGAANAPPADSGGPVDFDENDEPAIFRIPLGTG